MRTWSVFVMLLIISMISTSPALAQEEEGSDRNRSVGIGVLAGAAFPFANSRSYKITESWGFYVDIPVISTFHIAPSTTLYRLEENGGGNHGIADLDVNFKFVIPVNIAKIFFAAMMGASYGSFVEEDVIHLNVGANTGFAVRLVSNLDFVALCQYKLIIDGDQSNVNMMQAMAGLQFNF